MVHFPKSMELGVVGELFRRPGSCINRIKKARAPHDKEGLYENMLVNWNGGGRVRVPPVLSRTLPDVIQLAWAEQHILSAVTLTLAGMPSCPYLNLQGPSLGLRSLALPLPLNFSLFLVVYVALGSILTLDSFLCGV